MPSLPIGTVTFMFTDVEGSTRLIRGLGGAAGPVFDRHDAIVRGAIVDHGGVVVATEGDSFFAVFAHAADAVEAAIDAQRRIRGEQWPPEGRVAVRIGLHTGRGELGGSDYRGIDVNRAARISAAGHGGQILVSDATRALIHAESVGALDLVDLGEFSLKDLEGPYRLWQVRAEGLELTFPELRAVPVRIVDLPAPATSFVGRVAELDRIDQQLLTTRLLTLTGPGGVGKTRLSVEVARRVSSRFDGVSFVPLASVTETELLAPTIAARLEVEAGRGATLDRLVKHLDGARWLLVLDNFEQLLGGSAIVGELLRLTGGLTCLVTSRAPLGLSGEVEFRLPPLGGALTDTSAEGVARHDGAALLVERARAIYPDFEVDDDNAEAVAAITTRLDGLPLAIELAAARLRLLSPGDLAARLSSSLDLLRTAHSDRPERQRTLRATIAWSYDLLEPQQQLLLRQLGVFHEGCDLAAIEAVCGGPGLDDMLAELEALVVHSLVRSDPSSQGTRFVILVTIRAFALEQLVAAPEEQEEVRERHYRHYAELASRAAPELLKADRGQWLSQLAVELGNLRAAMSWALEVGAAGEACRLVGSLWRFWHTRGDLAEGRMWTGAALALEGAKPLDRLAALEAAGGIAYWAADLASAGRHYDEALEIARAHGTPRHLADALYNAAFGLGFQQDWEATDRIIDEALAIYQQLGLVDGIARTLWARGTVALTRGDAGTARDAFEEALGILEQMDDLFQLGWGHRMLAATLLDLGEAAAARGHIEAGMDIFVPAADTSGIILLLRDFTKLAVVEGNDRRAMVLAGTYQALQDRSGLHLVDALNNEVPEITQVAERLGPASAAELRALGTSMTTEEAVEFARQPGEGGPGGTALLDP